MNYESYPRTGTSAARDADPRLAETVTGPVLSGEPANLATARFIARLTDDLVKVPGTNIGVGLDGVVGLVPGVGDLVGTALSSIILVESVRNRVPMHVLGRMGWNLVVDTGLGFVPVAGDVLDVAHRANRKNARLLEKAVAEGKQVSKDVKSYAIRAGITVGAMILALATVTVFAIWLLLKLLGLLL